MKNRIDVDVENNGFYTIGISGHEIVIDPFVEYEILASIYESEATPTELLVMLVEHLVGKWPEDEREDAEKVVSVAVAKRYTDAVWKAFDEVKKNMDKKPGSRTTTTSTPTN